MEDVDCRDTHGKVVDRRADQTVEIFLGGYLWLPGVAHPEAWVMVAEALLFRVLSLPHLSLLLIITKRLY